MPKAADQAEATGWVVLVQDVAESRVAVTAASAVKAEDSAEAVGVDVPVQGVAKATVKAMLVTSLGRIEEDAAEKNSYIDSSFMPWSKVGLPHLAPDGVRRALYWIRHAEKAWNIGSVVR